MTTLIDKTKWVELFKQVGITDEQMRQWHQLFEAQYPQAHADFLRWLGLSAEEIEKVRHTK